MLAKFAISAEKVWQMPVLELSAWINDYLEFEGVKQSHPQQENNQGTTQKSFVFTHRGKNLEGR